MSLLLRLLVPLARSRCSRSPVLSPRVTASSAVPTPTIPPPTTSTSSSACPASPSIAARASSRACGPRALCWLMHPVWQTTRDSLDDDLAPLELLELGVAGGRHRAAQRAHQVHGAVGHP